MSLWLTVACTFNYCSCSTELLYPIHLLWLCSDIWLPQYVRGCNIWRLYYWLCGGELWKVLCSFCQELVMTKERTRLSKVIWKQAASPPWLIPHTTPNCSSTIRALSHSYAANSPLVTMGRPTFAAKFPPPVDRSLNPTTCLIPGPIRPTIPNWSVSDQLFCHNALDRQTHRPTDGWRECSMTVGRFAL